MIILVVNQSYLQYEEIIIYILYDSNLEKNFGIKSSLYILGVYYLNYYILEYWYTSFNIRIIKNTYHKIY